MKGEGWALPAVPKVQRDSFYYLLMLKSFTMASQGSCSEFVKKKKKKKKKKEKKKGKKKKKKKEAKLN